MSVMYVLGGVCLFYKELEVKLHDWSVFIFRKYGQP